MDKNIQNMPNFLPKLSFIYETLLKQLKKGANLIIIPRTKPYQLIEWILYRLGPNHICTIV